MPKDRNSESMWNSIPFALIMLLLTGCTSGRQMYMVSVVDRSHVYEPIWIKGQQANGFIGIGEAPTKDAAYNAALLDLRLKVAQEMGLELEMQRLTQMLETRQGIDESSRVTVNVMAEALVRDIHDRITDVYWEQCRAQTGRKSFSDFYRYYVRANIDCGFIEELRTLTRQENNQRWLRMQGFMDKADSLLSIADPPQPFSAMLEVVNAFDAANMLFWESGIHLRECQNLIEDIIQGMTIETVEVYNEVRPERHWFDFRILYMGRPAQAVEVNFILDTGFGRIQPSATSDENGMVKCEVFEIHGLRSDNSLSVEFDLNNLYSRLSLLEIKDIYKYISELQNLSLKKRKVEIFSTLAKKARVQGSSLIIDDIYGRHHGIYRRISSLDCSFTLREVNGRSVRFTGYDLKVTCWHTKTIFGGKQRQDSTAGSYGFNHPLSLEYLQETSFTPSALNKIGSMLNQLKAAHENTMKSVQIVLTLYGKDDAGNEIAVTMSTDKIPWKSFFER